MSNSLTRRGLLGRMSAGLSALMLAGCDRLSETAWVRSTLDGGEDLTQRVQRLVLGPGDLAMEYTTAEISQVFKANGSTEVDDSSYRALAQNGFANWRLEVDGLVKRPLRLSLADLRAMPARTQITRHDCVEGWSCIGQWTGVPLGAVLSRAGLKPEARFIVFRCADTLEQTLDGTGQYYESIGLEDAFHLQTILAYDMNGKTLTEPHGAPLRLRVERQLGYKMAKYIMRIEVVESFAGIGRGRGGYWEDRGYEWYAGI